MFNLEPQESFKLISKKFRGKEYLFHCSEVFRPRFSEIDSYQVMWNGHILQYFETSRLELCRKFHFSLKDWADKELFFPIHNYKVEMKRPLKEGDQFQILSRPSRFEDGVLEFLHLTYVGKQLHNIGKICHVALDGKTGMKLPDVPLEAKELLLPMLHQFKTIQGNENENEKLL